MNDCKISPNWPIWSRSKRQLYLFELPYEFYLSALLPSSPTTSFSTTHIPTITDTHYREEEFWNRIEMTHRMSVTFLGTSSGGGPVDTRSCSSQALDIVGNGNLWCTHSSHLIGYLPSDLFTQWLTVQREH